MAGATGRCVPGLSRHVGSVPSEHSVPRRACPSAHTAATRWSGLPISAFWLAGAKTPGLEGGLGRMNIHGQRDHSQVVQVYLAVIMRHTEMRK